VKIKTYKIKTKEMKIKAPAATPRTIASIETDMPQTMKNP